MFYSVSKDLERRSIDAQDDDHKAGVVSSSFYPKASPPKAIHISKKLAIRQTKKDFSEFSFSTRYRLCINEPYCCKSNNSYFSSFLPLKQQRIIAKILRCIPKKSLPFPSPFFFNFKQKTNSEIQQKEKSCISKTASCHIKIRKRKKIFCQFLSAKVYN